MTDKFYGSRYWSEVYHDVQAKHGSVYTWEQRKYYESACGGVFFFAERSVGSTPPAGKRLCQRCAKARTKEKAE